MAKTAKAKVWVIWVGIGKVVDLHTVRTTRRRCIKDYVSWYGKNSKPRPTWRQLYSWGWRCLPVDFTFKKPR